MAPPFAFSGVIASAAMPTGQADDLAPTGLRGKVVVLDFFATWCAPCEETAVLRSFLADHPFKATIATDADGTTYRNYFVKGLPFVVIIDVDGRSPRLRPLRRSRWP